MSIWNLQQERSSWKEFTTNSIRPFGKFDNFDNCFSFFAIAIMEDYKGTWVCVVGFYLNSRRFFSILKFGTDSECAIYANLLFYNLDILNTSAFVEKFSSSYEERGHC